MRQSPLKRGKPRRLTEEERMQAWEFKLSVVSTPCAACGFAPSLYGPPIDAHHVISAQYLRSNHPEHVYDRRNALPTCRDCHERHENASRRLPRSCLRPENEDFAQELGLEHLLDRFYPRGDGS